MKAYAIKQKKTTNFFNNELTFKDDIPVKENVFFLRKKDAQKYLNILMFKHLFEIIKLEVKQLETKN